jgi:quaternary ammonium compound-resistance protein SugE
MAWVYLVLAGIFEFGWPIGLKMAWQDGTVRWGPAVFAALSMVASGVLLFLAQRDLPIGTAYAVWTGIGAVGVFAIGIAFLGESANVMRLASAGLILAGIMGLKAAG